MFIKDIARGLSAAHRFNGQTVSRMTAAEHSYIVSFIGNPKYALERLMHDATEGYIHDFIRPLKVIPIFGAIYLKIEAGIEKAIGQRYGLQTPFLDVGDVLLADEIVLKAELALNIGSKADPLWDDRSVVYEQGKVRLYCWSPALAEDMFLSRFYELARERGIEPF